MKKSPRPHSLTRGRFQRPLVVNGIRCCSLDFGSNQTCPSPQQTDPPRSHLPVFFFLSFSSLLAGRCVFAITLIVYTIATAIARSHETVSQDRCANCIRMLREDFRIPRTFRNSHLYHHSSHVNDTTVLNHKDFLSLGRWRSSVPMGFHHM